MSTTVPSNTIPANDNTYYARRIAKRKGYTQNEDGSYTDPATKQPVEITDAEIQEEAQIVQGRLNTAANVFGTALDIGSAALGYHPNVQNQSGLTQGLNQGFNAATNIVSQINPVVGGIMKVGGFAADGLTAAGIGTDQVTTKDKLLDSKFMKLTPVGLANSLGAKSSDSFSIDETALANVGGSYGGEYNFYKDTEDVAGKKFGLFSSKDRKRANARIAEANRRMNLMRTVSDEATDRSLAATMMSSNQRNAYAFDMNGGYDQTAMRVQQGGTLDLKEDIEEDLKDEYSLQPVKPFVFKTVKPFTLKAVRSFTPVAVQEFDIKTVPYFNLQTFKTPKEYGINTFKKGGYIKANTRLEKLLDAPEIAPTSQMSLIPEGALHKNKHTIKGIDHITKKGIPVIDHNKLQQAEIEKEEIIFTKEVTDKLEELYEIYYDDDTDNEEKNEIAISVGKLITKEIMFNTDDRTGLINTLKKGGVLN